MTEQQRAYLRELIGRRTERIPFSGCWIWEGATLGKGYGSLRAFGKRHFLAHRAAYEAHKGALPSHLQVCHRCDISACCNPAHLFVGTNNDNIADSMQKGRRKGITRRRPSGLVYKNSRVK